MANRTKIFISYASPDHAIATKIAECLKSREIWFDQIEVAWGDHIVKEINEGLSKSFMGIVILSNNFFDRQMTQLELNSMVFLMNMIKFRILPLYHNIDHQRVVEQFPLLSNVRGEKADQDCETLLSKLDAAIKKTGEIVNIPKVSPQTVSVSEHSFDKNSNAAAEIGQNEMETISADLTKPTTKSRREVSFTKLRHYSDTKRIWKHNSTWEIISYLLDSKITEEVITGLYVIEYMIKFSQREYSGDLNSIIENARERFASLLLNLIDPSLEKRIPQDSFRILSMITTDDLVSKYALEALEVAMREIVNDNEYSNYIQIYIWHFDNASKENIKVLCQAMYDLTSKEGKLAERAAELYKYYFKKL